MAYSRRYAVRLLAVERSAACCNIGPSGLPRPCTAGHVSGRTPSDLWRSSGRRHAHGSPRVTGPRRSSPGPARRDVSPDAWHTTWGRPSALAACRSGPQGDRGSSGPPRVRHGAVSLRPICQAGRRDRSDRRPGGGCTSGANTGAGLASRQPFRSRWLGVSDGPGGRDEASRPRRVQPKVVHLLARSLWLRTDGDAPWGFSIFHRSR